MFSRNLSTLFLLKQYTRSKIKNLNENLTVNSCVIHINFDCNKIHNLWFVFKCKKNTKKKNIN